MSKQLYERLFLREPLPNDERRCCGECHSMTRGYKELIQELYYIGDLANVMEGDLEDRQFLAHSLNRIKNEALEVAARHERERGWTSEIVVPR